MFWSKVPALATTCTSDVRETSSQPRAAKVNVSMNKTSRVTPSPSSVPNTESLRIKSPVTTAFGERWTNLDLVHSSYKSVVTKS